MDRSRKESVGAHDYGFEKFGAEGLLASSVGLGWSGLSAALLTHGRGVVEYQGAESGAEVCVARQGLDRRRLTRVKEYIAANLEGDLTIAQLASVACLSRYHFARAFKTAVGQPPHQYVSAQRLERAKEMLMRGDQSLLDIAIALNFSSHANFTRAFRLGTGMTPGQFQRNFAR